METYTDQKIYRFLQDLAFTRQNLEKHFSSNGDVVSLFDQLQMADSEEKEKIGSMLSEIGRDGRILKRRLSCIMDKAYSIQLNKNVPEDLSKIFIDLLQGAKEYNDKWKEYYAYIDGELASILC